MAGGCRAEKCAHERLIKDDLTSHYATERCVLNISRADIPGHIAGANVAARRILDAQSHFRRRASASWMSLATRVDV